MTETLEKRRHLLNTKVLPRLVEPIRQSPELKGRMKDLIRSVRMQGLEGLIAKRRDSSYEAGERSGAWQKMRINQGQEFVIGGYTISGATFLRVAFSPKPTATGPECRWLLFLNWGSCFVLSTA